MRAQVILTLQGLLMIVIAVGPVFDPDERKVSITGHDQVGLILCLVGLALFLLTLKELGRSFTIEAKPRETGILVKTGVFQFCRNPMYFGGLLMCLGWAIGFTSLSALVGTFLIAFVLRFKISIEEAELEKKFGQTYLEYRAQVKRLIPYIY